ncbi:hypothetical protein V6N13_092690 [Hibiscus sabdariffa]
MGLAASRSFAATGDKEPGVAFNQALISWIRNSGVFFRFARCITSELGITKEKFIRWDLSRKGHGPLSHHFHELRQRPWTVKIQHMLRAGNLVADMLAKEAAQTAFETYIVESRMVCRRCCFGQT